MPGAYSIQKTHIHIDRNLFDRWCEDRQNVKLNSMSIFLAIQYLHAKILCLGHTHIQYIHTYICIRTYYEHEN